MFRTTLRRVRLAMDDEGPLGLVLASHPISILASIRDLLCVAILLICCLEAYFRPHLRRLLMDEKAAGMDRIWEGMNRHMPPDQIHDPPSAVGRLLESGVGGIDIPLLYVPDLIIWACYKFLNWYTLTDVEKLERKLEEQGLELERDEKRARGEEPEDEKRMWILERVALHKWFSHFRMALIIALVWDLGTQIKGDFDYEFSEHEVDKRRVVSGLETIDLALINPWRDLQPSQDGVLRDLVYIKDTLSKIIPTSLPEDDFELYSDMLRYLETRNDISWRTFEDLEISATISSAANCQDVHPSEPKSLRKRLNKLHSHWHDLQVAPTKPERWQDEADTVFLKPLISGHGFGGDVLRDVDARHLNLTPEQAAAADMEYRKWRKNRDRKALYLRLHPPSPMAWIPVMAEQRDSYSEIRALSSKQTVDMGNQCGSGMTVGKVVVEKSTGRAWKPLHHSLLTADVPYGWVPPGEEKETATGDARQYLTDWEAESARRDMQREITAQMQAEKRKKREEEREQAAKIEL